jgi:Tol biopolymer transport system component
LFTVSDLAGNASDPVWSNDDQRIAYESDLDGDRDIYVYEISSGLTRLMTDNGVADYAPTWICNSSTVVFVSEIAGDANIYDADSSPIDGPPPAPTQRTFDPAQDQAPANLPLYSQ